jgi:hypothetical protein
MRLRQIGIGLAAAGLVGFAQAQQPSAVPAEGVSDIGSFEQVPYRLEPQVSLRTEDRMALRRLEDRHIAELRAFEDRYEKELRAMRARQQLEREAAIKAFSRR